MASNTKMTINQYTEKSYVVQGTDTKVHKEQLKVMGCKYNPNLKCGAGWIISKTKYPEVNQYVNEVYNEKRELRVAEVLNKAQGPGPIRQKPVKVEAPIITKIIVPPKRVEVVDTELQDNFVALEANYNKLKEKHDLVTQAYENLKEEVKLKDESETARREVHALEIQTLKAKIAKYKAKLAKYQAEVKIEEAPVVIVEEEPAPATRETCRHVKQNGTRCLTKPRGGKEYCGNHGRGKKE
jgi:hypothetical protein